MRGEEATVVLSFVMQAPSEVLSNGDIMSTVYGDGFPMSTSFSVRNEPEPRLAFPTKKSLEVEGHCRCVFLMARRARREPDGRIRGSRARPPEWKMCGAPARAGVAQLRTHIGKDRVPGRGVGPQPGLAGGTSLSEPLRAAESAQYR